MQCVSVTYKGERRRRSLPEREASGGAERRGIGLILGGLEREVMCMNTQAWDPRWEKVGIFCTVYIDISFGHMFTKLKFN